MADSMYNFGGAASVGAALGLVTEPLAKLADKGAREIEKRHKEAYREAKKGASKSSTGATRQPTGSGRGSTQGMTTNVTIKSKHLPAVVKAVQDYVVAEGEVQRQNADKAHLHSIELKQKDHENKVETLSTLKDVLAGGSKFKVEMPEGLNLEGTIARPSAKNTETTRTRTRTAPAAPPAAPAAPELTPHQRGWETRRRNAAAAAKNGGTK